MGHSEKSECPFIFMLNNLSYNDFFLILISIGLVLLYSFGIINASVSSTLVLIGFLFPGVTHGTLDIELIKAKHPAISRLKILSVYILSCFLVLMLWYLNVKLVFAIFILYSAFHFGESDLQISNFSSNLFFLLHGLIVLIIYCFYHFLEFEQIVSTIMNVTVTIDFDSSLLELISEVIFVIWGAVLIYSAKAQNRIKWVVRLFLIGAGFFMPLVEGFAVYYFFIHSWPALVKIKYELNFSVPQMIKKSIPYVLGTLVLLICFFKSELILIQDQKSIYAAIFIFISIISLPHTWIMHRVFKG